jgi:short-subunit dehydrogenase
MAAGQGQGRPLAVVTGASSGIGFELAKVFAQEGFDLVVTSADPSRLDEARTALVAHGGAVDAVQADLATYDGVEKLWTHVQSLDRPVEAIALNAGVGAGGDFARQTRLEDDLAVVQLNVTSVVHLAKRVVQDMLGRGRGRVLFTSSIAAALPSPFNAVYGASKAFVQSFAQALRNELKDTAITVTALMPGATDTAFFERAGMEDTRVGQQDKDDPADVARAGFQALMAGKDHVVAGSLKNKVLAGSGKVLPQTAAAQLHRKLNEPGSGEK